MQWDTNVLKRVELPQWISDLDGGFYKQDETIEYATPVSHFVKNGTLG